MSWRSIYGTGATIHDIDRTADDRVEFTVWLTVFWIPLIPVSSWSAIYTGEAIPDGVTDDGYCFRELRRIPHDWTRLIQTFACGMILGVAAVAPVGYMIARIDGRAATAVEWIFLYASASWPVLLIVLCEKRRRNRLRGT